MQWEHLTLGGTVTEVGKSTTHWANSGRIIEYFRDSYADRLEVIDKSHVFMSVHEFIAAHMRRFKWHGLVKAHAEPGRLYVSHALFRAVLFAMLSLGTDADIKPRKIVNLAKAFRAIDPSI